ncbi:MAG: non-hydrolyzing UDP-N-acetylglucosamine 2-epimerase [Akkermansiaceae bacterium]|jgi:UDP-N-acetylglucosamine 2-epimerase (non-hydrolysing)
MKAIFIFGTRPEAIKMAPVIKEFKRSGEIEPIVAVTGQHRDMLDQVLHFFGIIPDYNLNLMTEGQSLCSLTSRAIQGIETIIDEIKPNILLVQGDTTSAFVGAYVGFLKRVPVAHIEAGLRTGHRHEPFPEEINRQLVGNLADLHFCPTDNARDNLLAEGKSGGISVVGNTVIDALLDGLKILGKNWQPTNHDLDRMMNPFGSVLITIHRRESFGNALLGILNAIKRLALNHPSVSFVFPVHPNPNIRKPVYDHLKDIPNLLLTEPLDYPNFIWAMSKSRLILTDSGGVQEEAPTLGIPVFVVRNVTERQEGVEVGVATLVGTDEENIVSTVSSALEGETRHQLVNPYGDGTTSSKILELCLAKLNS